MKGLDFFLDKGCPIAVNRYGKGKGYMISIRLDPESGSRIGHYLDIYTELDDFHLNSKEIEIRCYSPVNPSEYAEDITGDVFCALYEFLLLLEKKQDEMSSILALLDATARKPYLITITNTDIFVNNSQCGPEESFYSYSLSIDRQSTSKGKVPQAIIGAMRQVAKIVWE